MFTSTSPATTPSWGILKPARCIYKYVYISICIYVNMHIYIHMYIYMCVYMNV